jgi:hypothetical protein
VVNVIGGKAEGAVKPKTDPNGQPVREKTPEEIAAEQQARFQAMRERLLNQDPRID